MKNIVVGFDGTDASFVAVDWAAHHVARMPARVDPVRVDIVMIGGMVFSDDFRIDASLAEAERRLHDHAPDAAVNARRFPGTVPDSLFERAAAADLLVVGAHRSRPVRTALAGWLPLRIASRSRIPVVIVPDDWSATDGPVVVGIDDDDSSAIALATAAELADAAAARLVLVHAWQMPTPQMDGGVALLASPITVKAENRTLLRDAARRIASAYPAVRVEQVLVQGAPAVAVLTASQDAALLVLGTHHRGLFAGALLGSVGQEVLAESPVPVCIVPNDRARLPGRA